MVSYPPHIQATIFQWRPQLAAKVHQDGGTITDAAIKADMSRNTYAKYFDRQGPGYPIEVAANDPTCGPFAAELLAGAHGGTVLWPVEEPTLDGKIGNENIRLDILQGHILEALQQGRLTDKQVVLLKEEATALVQVATQLQLEVNNILERRP